MIKLIMIYVAFIRPEFSRNYCGGPALHVIEAWFNWASSFVQSLLATFFVGYDTRALKESASKNYSMRVII